MDEKRIEEIVRKVFEKAKEEHASHSRFALSNHISSKSYLSSKTLERAYDRYVDGNKKNGPPNAESINLFCNYLGYEDYGVYVNHNSKRIPRAPWSINDNVKWILISASMVFGILLMIFGIQKQPLDISNSNDDTHACMTWADSLYIPISCDIGPLSKYGTQVLPLDQKMLKNMHKVEVNLAYQFFAEDGKPLVWYYKKSSKDIEYFTAPGLHPVNGETLRKITPHIINKYVPMHQNKEESFLK